MENNIIYDVLIIITILILVLYGRKLIKHYDAIKDPVLYIPEYKHTITIDMDNYNYNVDCRGFAIYSSTIGKYVVIFNIDNKRYYLNNLGVFIEEPFTFGNKQSAKNAVVRLGKRKIYCEPMKTDYTTSVSYYVYIGILTKYPLKLTKCERLAFKDAASIL